MWRVPNAPAASLATCAPETEEPAMKVAQRVKDLLVKTVLHLISEGIGAGRFLSGMENAVHRANTPQMRMVLNKQY